MLNRCARPPSARPVLLRPGCRDNHRAKPTAARIRYFCRPLRSLNTIAATSASDAWHLSAEEAESVLHIPSGGSREAVIGTGLGQDVDVTLLGADGARIE